MVDDRKHTEADAVLEAVHRSTGKDKSEVVRDVLHREGLSGASEGV